MPDTCVIEAVEELSRADFDDFRERMLRDYDFILDHSRSLMSGTDGRYHCLLVLCEGEPDGILVDSEGSAYARYSGLLPDARLILEDRCQRVARDLLQKIPESVRDFIERSENQEKTEKPRDSRRTSGQKRPVSGAAESAGADARGSGEKAT